MLRKNKASSAFKTLENRFVRYGDEFHAEVDVRRGSISVTDKAERTEPLDVVADDDSISVTVSGNHTFEFEVDSASVEGLLASISLCDAILDHGYVITRWQRGKKVVRSLVTVVTDEGVYVSEKRRRGWKKTLIPESEFIAPYTRRMPWK